LDAAKNIRLIIRPHQRAIGSEGDHLQMQRRRRKQRHGGKNSGQPAEAATI
jgi:hypothetical protein